MKRMIAALLLMSASVAAYAEVAGNVALTTDYRFRGISQSDRDPAIQGGFDWAHDSGFYLGTWASSVAFGGSTEIDFYGGYARDINENLNFDVGYMYYAYPSDNGTPDMDYQEIYGSFGFYGAKVGLVYSDDYFQSAGKFFYYYGEYSLPLGEIASLDIHLGYNDLDEPVRFGADSYVDFSIGVTASAVGLDFTLAYIDTDLSKDECFGGATICNATGVLTISKSL
jgi:uncharacterized protein (TIGR02001 family)